MDLWFFDNFQSPFHSQYQCLCSPSQPEVSEEAWSGGWSLDRMVSGTGDSGSTRLWQTLPSSDLSLLHSIYCFLHASNLMVTILSEPEPENYILYYITSIFTILYLFKSSSTLWTLFKTGGRELCAVFDKVLSKCRYLILSSHGPGYRTEWWWQKSKQTKKTHFGFSVWWCQEKRKLSCVFLCFVWAKNPGSLVPNVKHYWFKTLNELGILSY